MADQNRISRLAELHRAIQDKERELSDLDLMLADYHTERIRLIHELRRLWARLRLIEEASPDPH